MKKSNLWIITFGECSRLDRLREECDKKQMGLKVIKSYNVHVTNSKIFHNDKEIKFQKGDVIWSISNNIVGHHLIQYIYQRFQDELNFIWPDINAINFADKFWTGNFFSKNNIVTPKTVFINTFKVEKIEKLKNYVGGYPCVIKSCAGSMGENVEIVRTNEEVKVFIDKNMTRKVDVPFRRKAFLLQEFIKESSGTDFRVLCLDGEVLGVIKRTAQNGDFKANVSLGGKAEIIKLNDEMKKMAEKIMKKGNIFYAGIDFIKSDRGYLALEINTSAQFKGFEAATGTNVAEKIIKELMKK